MKNLFFIITLLPALVNQNTAFAQWQWAQSGTSAFSWDMAKSIASDSAGNAIVTGMFSSASINFGTFTLTNANAGTDDMFLVKYSPSGIPLWTQRAGGMDYDYGMAVATDASGNVYVTGHYYSSSIIFGNDTLYNTAGGGTDIYTVKYSSAGNALWARTGGGSGFDESTAMCTDASGNVYVAGEFYSPSMHFGSQTVTNSGTDTLDMFIVKYDAVGNVIWAISAGGAGNDAIMGITADRTGNIIITGSSGSPVCTFGVVTLTNPGIFGYDDAFTVKYDSSGNSLWGSSGAGDGFETGAGVAADTAGNIYVTGNFGSIFIVFGNDTLFNARTTGGPTDIFIVKYNSTGSVLWAKRTGTRFIDVASDIVTDINGDSYITGHFNDTTITFGITNLPNVGTSDIFVAKYDPSGNAISAYGAGESGIDQSFSLSADNAGELFIAGEFYSNTLSFGISTLVNSGYSDMFVAKLALPTGIEENTSDNENGNTLFPNPCTGYFTILSTMHNPIDILITNALGEIVYLSQNTGPQISINLNSVSKGVYYVRITCEIKSENKILIIQ